MPNYRKHLKNKRERYVCPNHSRLEKGFDLAGCSGVNVISLFKKMRIGFEKLSIDVKAETTDTVPMLYSAFFITFHVTGKAEESARIEKAIRLSQEYCGVSAMMKKIGPVTHRILLNGSELNIQPTDK